MPVATYPPFTIKVGDLARAIKYQLQDGNGTVVDLTGASSVSFRMTQNTPTSPKIVTGSASIVGAATLGTVQYQPVGTDTAVAGGFKAEFTVNWPGALPDTFPSDGYIDVEIYPRA